MGKSKKTARELHENVPPDWYYRSIRENIFQRFWHQRRFTEVKKVIEPTPGKILDIGSADGVFTQIILEQSQAKQIIGIDVLKTSVDWANRHWKDPRMKFLVGDAKDLKFKTNTFNAVFALEVLEHVFDPQLAFKEVKRVLKKGGYAVFLVPTDSWLFEIIWFFWKKWRGRIWKDTHIQSFNSHNPLTKNLKKVGFKIEIDKKFLLGMLNLVKARKK